MLSIFLCTPEQKSEKIPRGQLCECSLTISTHPPEVRGKWIGVRPVSTYYAFIDSSDM